MSAEPVAKDGGNRQTNQQQAPRSDQSYQKGRFGRGNNRGYARSNHRGGKNAGLSFGGQNTDRQLYSNDQLLDIAAAQRPQQPPPPDYMKIEFEMYSKWLDERNERQERIYVNDRDARIKSKKLIFLMHRLPTKRNERDKKHLLNDVDFQLKEVREINYAQIAKELIGQDISEFSFKYSQGLQEYFEAISFYTYITEEKLITQQELQDMLTFENEGEIYRVPVSMKDYLFGVLDIAGELHRYAINSVASGDRTQLPKAIHFLRKLLQACTLIAGQYSIAKFQRDFGAKLSVLRDSIKKAEFAHCKSVILANELSNEVPAHLIAQMMAALSQSNPQDSTLLAHNDDLNIDSR